MRFSTEKKLLFITACFMLCACNSHSIYNNAADSSVGRNNVDSQTKVDTMFSQTSDVTDDVDEELAEFLAGLPAEDFSEEDFILPNGTTMYDCLAAYAPAILEKNPWIKPYNPSSKTSNGNKE